MGEHFRHLTRQDVAPLLPVSISPWTDPALRIPATGVPYDALWALEDACARDDPTSR